MNDPRLATRALSIQQPWVDAILHGTKRVENRTWARKDELGWIWLHAPATGDQHAGRWMRERGLHTPDLGVPKSAIVGLAYIHTISNHVPDDDPWAFGPVCWHIYAVIALDEPVPCKGALGLWTLPPAALAKARAELATLDLGWVDALDYEWGGATHPGMEGC
jgi:hypothetical protein